MVVFSKGGDEKGKIGDTKKRLSLLELENKKGGNDADVQSSNDSISAFYACCGYGGRKGKEY